MSLLDERTSTEISRRSPEERLLLRSARTHLDDPDQLVSVVSGPLDWERVLRLAQNHGITPLVSRSLHEYCPEQTPTEILDRLRERSLTTARQNLHLTNELLEVLELLSDHGHEVLPYRGPVLAATAYDDLALRRFNDLDLLVRRGEIPDVKSLLSERGYDPAYVQPTTQTLNPTQEWAYTRFSRDFPLVRQSDGACVELHWRILSLDFPTSIELDTVWDRRETTTLAGVEVPVFSPEDQLLTLSIHGTRHYWERFERICDVAELLRRRTIDWDYVIERAREQNCFRMFSLGVVLAHELLDSELPERVHRTIREDSRIESLSRQVRERLFDSGVPHSFDTRRFQARTFDRRRDVLRFWAMWAFYPNRKEIELVPLNRSLVPLYFLVRPFKLLYRAGKRGAGRVR